MSVWETLGLSAGALSSGFAVILFEHRGLFADGNLSVFLISALLQVLIIACIVCWMRDFSLELPQELHPSATTFTSALQNRKFLSILILTFALGFVLSSLEKYWQVRLIAITVADDLATILLGVVSFLGFMTALIGSVFSGSLINRSRSSVSRYLLVFHILLAASLVLLAYAHSHISFLILYACVYLFVSMSSVASGTIINTEIPSSLRASLLSTVSFALQIGGLVSSLFASLYLAKERVTISSVWIIAAGVLLISLIPLGRSGIKKSYAYEVRSVAHDYP